MKKKAYVVGNNTRLSLSPLIFNYWFKKYNVDGEYGYVEVQESSFEKKIKELLNKNELCGLNITIPYKEKIIPLLYKINKQAKLIGAVNCVTKKTNKALGSNTDWVGFKNSVFLSNNIKQKKTKALIVGYGGSAKAALYALDKIGYTDVVLWNRSFDKIKNIKKYHKINIVPKELKKDNFYIDDGVELAINTIPVKKYFGQEIRKSKNLNNKITGYDLVYNKETSFLNYFSKPNQISGLNLLVHQAAPCFELWFGIRPEINEELFNLLSDKLERLK